jgi:hypothetical protein
VETQTTSSMHRWEEVLFANCGWETQTTVT